MIFELSRKNFDIYYPYLFEGPEMSQEAWKARCDSLWNEAARQVLRKNKGFVGTAGIVETLLPMLETCGFRRVKPVEHGYFGSDILRDATSFGNLPFDDETRRLVQVHNDVVYSEGLSQAKGGNSMTEFRCACGEGTVDLKAERIISLNIELHAGWTVVRARVVFESYPIVLLTIHPPESAPDMMTRLDLSKRALLDPVGIKLDRLQLTKIAEAVRGALGITVPSTPRTDSRAWHISRLAEKRELYSAGDDPSGADLDAAILQGEADRMAMVLLGLDCTGLDDAIELAKGVRAHPPSTIGVSP